MKVVTLYLDLVLFFMLKKAHGGGSQISSEEVENARDEVRKRLFSLFSLLFSIS